ncbi:hypothetical protein BJ165DRAFT_1530373 [Panaeolus papilionaceus]|nr:hypothetical protein BJ165DRAFT_1530373 [Panaeolus papilionaceus]
MTPSKCTPGSLTNVMLIMYWSERDLSVACSPTYTDADAVANPSAFLSMEHLREASDTLFESLSSFPLPIRSSSTSHPSIWTVAPRKGSEVELFISTSPLFPTRAAEELSDSKRSLSAGMYTRVTSNILPWELIRTRFISIQTHQVHLVMINGTPLAMPLTLAQIELVFGGAGTRSSLNVYRIGDVRLYGWTP